MVLGGATKLTLGVVGGGGNISVLWYVSHVHEQRDQICSSSLSQILGGKLIRIFFLLPCTDGFDNERFDRHRSLQGTRDTLDMRVRPNVRSID